MRVPSPGNDLYWNHRPDETRSGDYARCQVEERGVSLGETAHVWPSFRSRSSNQIVRVGHGHDQLQMACSKSRDREERLCLSRYFNYSSCFSFPLSPFSFLKFGCHSALNIDSTCHSSRGGLSRIPMERTDKPTWGGLMHDMRPLPRVESGNHAHVGAALSLGQFLA
jgi:hypothetical protein